MTVTAYEPWSKQMELYDLAIDCAIGKRAWILRKPGEVLSCGFLGIRL